jgi:hypothetical protein
MKKLLVAASIVLLLYIAIAMLGHAAQLADVADRVLPGAGIFVFWGLVALLYGGPMVLVAMFYRLPKALIPPKATEGPEHDEYIQMVAARLRGNPVLKGERIESPEDLEAALVRLSKEANTVIRGTASSVFVSTAVLQNGRLDGLIVLATQLRLVWHIARIYYQRPSPRQLLHLYGNVSANVLIADSIQEIDFAEISVPIVTSIFPSLKGSIPGLQGVASLLVNSMANGTANAFLTLRIGILARTYCEATAEPDKGLLRSSVTMRAMVLAKDIAKEQGAEIAERAWESVKGVVMASAEKTVDAVKASAQKVSDVTVGAAMAVKDSAVGSVQTISDIVTRRGKEQPGNDPLTLQTKKLTQ